MRPPVPKVNVLNEKGGDTSHIFPNNVYMRETASGVQINCFVPALKLKNLMQLFTLWPWTLFYDDDKEKRTLSSDKCTRQERHGRATITDR